MQKIILASASPRRSELLNQIGLQFDVVPANIDETIPGDFPPEITVQELSMKKATFAASMVDPENLVIAADTIVVMAGKVILGKPKDADEAFEMLKSLSGEWHEVITGISVIKRELQKETKGFEKTRVKMRKLTDDMIRAYINTGEPMDKAGAYGIQGMGALLVERLEGCYFNVVGLPLVKLCKMLEEYGIKVLG